MHDRHMTLGRHILTSTYICYCACVNNQFLSTRLLSLLYSRVDKTKYVNENTQVSLFISIKLFMIILYSS